MQEKNNWEIVYENFLNPSRHCEAPIPAGQSNLPAQEEHTQ